MRRRLTREARVPVNHGELTIKVCWVNSDFVVSVFDKEKKIIDKNFEGRKR